MMSQDASAVSGAPAKFFEVKDKTGLVFTLEDKPGILNDALIQISNHNIDLTRIESKPSKYVTDSKYSPSHCRESPRLLH